MHFDDGQIPEEYKRYTGRKLVFISLTLAALIAGLVISVSLGAANLSLAEVIKTLVGMSESKRFDAIIWNIRLPQALAAIVAGGALAVSGAVMQSILRNPLGSPFTLGISNAAAFGAALSMMLQSGILRALGLDGGVSIWTSYLTTGTAFVFSILAAVVIILISRTRGATPEVMVLSGIAMGSLFTAGTMFLQFFANDVELASMVYWTFGDTARADWGELGIASAVTVLVSIYFFANAWNYNAIDTGDETARSLGVPVNRIRIIGMLAASLLTAVIVSFLGIIGFVGLVIPHMVRRIIGADHRFLLPASVMGGGLLLLLSDTAARLVISPQVVPVSILTAFLGAPVFIYLIIRGYRH